MKQLYFSILFFSLALFVSAQTNPTGSSTETGVTSGNLSVTLSGGASYTIPVAVPPGIKGVEPNLSLSYNSQGGNGMVGYGWGISGISTISRIPATKFHDNTIDGVDFNALDRFAIDGERLIVKNGTGLTYGANNTVYETENFSNLKITSFGVHPNGANYGPAYFLVEYPDGSKAYYGNSTDSRSITEWSITYWENAQGARISYSYNAANNLLEIASIKYGTLTTTAPINTVQFVYEARAKQESYYVGGQNIKRNNRLKIINITGSGTGFRSYELKYLESSLKYEYLNSVTEKSGDNTKSYNPIVFTYSGTNNDISYVTNPSILSVDNSSSLNSAAITGDFDGDGNMDFILYPTTGTNAKAKYWLFTGISPNTGAQSLPNFGLMKQPGAFQEIFPVSFLSWNNKLMYQQGWTIIQGNTFTTYAYSGSTIPQQDQKIYNFPTFVLDYYYDCQGINSQQQSKTFSEPTDPGPGEPTPAHYESDIPRTFISGDFNGDGLTDIVAIEKSFTYPYVIGCTTVNAIYSGGKTTFINLDKRLTSNYANGAGSLYTKSTSKIQVADFNGDGKSDIYIFDTGVITIYSLDDSKHFVLLSQFSDTGIVLSKPALIGDYNGDGKSDFMIPVESNNGWYRYTSTGTSFVKETKTNLPFILNDPYTSYNYTATDYNNDGKSDFNIIKNYRNGSAGTIQVIAYTETIPGTFFVQSAITTAQAAIDIYALPVYLPSTDNQKPRLEIAFINNNKLHFFNSQKNSNKDRLLTTITNGNGVQEFITYQPLDQIYKMNFNPVYRSSPATENYPYFDIVASPDFQIVSKLEKKSETVSKMKLYGYSGAVTNYEGLGFMGFRSTMETSWHDSSNLGLCTITNRDFKRRGAVTESYLLPYIAYPYNDFTSTSFTTKSVFTYTPANVDDALLANKVFKYQNTKMLVSNGLENTTAETTNIFDTNNNVTSSTSEIKEGGSIVQKATTTIAYQPAITAPLYILGRPVSRSQTVEVNGSTMTNSEAYTYNAQQLLLNTDKISAGATTISETNNTYDSYGNIKKKTITAAASRAALYEYDITGRFLTKITDTNNLVSTFEYDNNGFLKKQTNPYVSTSYTPDSWFKNLTVKDELQNILTTYNYNKSGKETIITTTAASGTGTLDTSVSEDKFDDLGRMTRSGIKDLNGAFTYVSYLYDIYDRAYQISEPYFGANPSQWNVTQFDIYSRPTQNTLFNGRNILTSYVGLKTTTIDGQKSKELIRNAVGNVISSKDNPLGGTINYNYFANGNLMKTSYNGIDIVMEQDNWGNKTKLIDPSAGTYVYGNNGFGELTSETILGTDITTTIVRDPANGKITKKTITSSDTSSETDYTYDGVLPLTIIYVDKKEPAGINKTTTTITYDSSKRIQSIVEDKTGVYKFTKTFTYDALGRIAAETKTAVIGSKLSTVATKNEYKNGFLYRILDSNNKVLWQTNTLNAKGQITESITGNGIKMTNMYNDGYLSKIQHDKTTAPTGNVITLTTAFNKNTDNLDGRINSSFGNYAETFNYDGINRLTDFTNKYGTIETQSYDASGKITANNLGTYGYDPVKKYQNTSVALTPEASGYYANREGIFNDSMEDRTGWGTEKYPNTNFYSYDGTKTGNSAGKNTLKLANTTTTEQYVFCDKWVDINNTAPTQYTYSAWVYSDNPQSEIVLYMKDAANTVTQTNTVNNVKGAWTQIIGTFSVPAAIKKLRLRLDNNGLGNIWYDDVEIRKTSDPTSGVRNLIVSYNAFKSPIQIEEKNVDKISFSYNDNNLRSTMYYGDFQTDKFSRPLRKYYSADGTMEIKENRTTGIFEFLTYIGGDAYSAPIVSKSDGVNPAKYLYLHRDYQGSILVITDDNAAVVEKRLFDAWGSIVKVLDGAGNTLNGLTVLDRGYTGHEHLQSIGIINMNARLYDPMLHRFLQTDNYIQDPTNTQNYNQYGYVMNNPLSYTDPSGNKYSDGKECIDCGPSSSQQTAIGSLIGTIASNWDSWRIKDWSNRNLNFDKWSDGVKSAKNFIGNNIKSGLKDVGSIFDRKSDGPPPNMSSYTNVTGNNIVFIPGLAESRKAIEEWNNKPLFERLTTSKPEDPYMLGNSGGLGFITGGGAMKFVQYSGEGLSLLKKTEVFNGLAQNEKAIAEIMSKMKAGDVSIYTEGIYTYLYKGERYILDGHHRIEAAIRSGKTIEAIELSGMKMYTKFADKINEIRAGLHF